MDNASYHLIIGKYTQNSRIPCEFQRRNNHLVPLVAELSECILNTAIVKNLGELFACIKNSYEICVQVVHRVI